MSQIVSSATETPTSASISTPVLPVVTTSTVASIRSSSASNPTFTAPIGIGWHMGMIREVSLTARMAATRGGREDVPLDDRPERDRGERLGSELDPAGRDRPARDLVLVRDVDHPDCVPLDVRELGHPLTGHTVPPEGP